MIFNNKKTVERLLNKLMQNHKKHLNIKKISIREKNFPSTHQSQVKDLGW